MSLNPNFFSCWYKMAGVYINVYPDDTWVTGKSLLYYNVCVIIVYYIDACEILIFPSETKADISFNICFTVTVPLSTFEHPTEEQVPFKRSNHRKHKM